MSFPTRLTELTVDWLNEALRPSGLLGSNRIVRFEAAPASGRGGTSTVRVLTLAYESPAPTAPTRLLIKFSSESETIRETVREHRLYEREVAFYERFGGDPGIPTPACYFARFDPASNTCALLIEYFEPGASPTEPEANPEELEAAVRCLAPFHAKWWERKETLETLERETCCSIQQRRARKVAQALARVREGNHGGSMGEAALAILDLWLGHVRILAEHSGVRPHTMCHGSFHRGQILFPKAAGGQPRVIDWQNVSANLGASDLARLLVSGLSPTQRREHERPLMELYHGLLLECGVRDYPWDQFLDDYRLGIANLIVFHSLILADYSVEVISKHWKGKEPFWVELFGWPGDAARDWRALDWLRATVATPASHA